MSEKQSKQPYQKPSSWQMQLLINFMADHPEVASGHSMHAQEYWAALFPLLNSGCGVQKTLAGWQKTWSDLVYTARQSVKAFNNGERSAPVLEHHKKIFDIVGPMHKKLKTNGASTAHNLPSTSFEHFENLESTTANGPSVSNDNATTSNVTLSVDDCKELFQEMAENLLQILKEKIVQFFNDREVWFQGLLQMQQQIIKEVIQESVLSSVAAVLPTSTTPATILPQVSETAVVPSSNQRNLPSSNECDNEPLGNNEDSRSLLDLAEIGEENIKEVQQNGEAAMLQLPQLHDWMENILLEFDNDNLQK